MIRRALLIVSLVAVPACARPTADVVTLSEFAINAAEMLPAGGSSLEVTNGGEFPHSLVVSTQEGHVVASSAVLDPGEATTLDVQLEPGEYQLTCRIVVEVPGVGLIDHYAEGMESTVLVEG